MSLVCNGERVVGNGSPFISRVFVGSPSASFNSQENDVVCNIHRISVYRRFIVIACQCVAQTCF